MFALLIKFWPVIATTILYIVQAGILLWTKQWGAALMFVSYSLANIGLIWSLS